MPSIYLIRPLMLAACGALLCVVGCAQQPSAEQAQAAANQTQMERNRDVATAQSNPGLTGAEQARDLAQKRCEPETGDAFTACMQQAHADYEAAKAQLQSQQDTGNSMNPNAAR